MPKRSLRRSLFLALFLLAPLPMVGIDVAIVPAARYCLLTGVCLSVAFLEGGAGPVGAIAALFAANAILYTLLLWGIAWGASRLLAHLPAAATRNALLGTIAIAILLALLFDLYTTPYGTAPHTNLIGVLS